MFLLTPIVVPSRVFNSNDRWITQCIAGGRSKDWSWVGRSESSDEIRLFDKFVAWYQ